MIEEISGEAARTWFDKLPADRKLASLNPGYVCADAQRDAESRQIFVLFRDERGFWMHGGHIARIPNYDHFDFQSPYGYGGPVHNCDAPLFQADAWGAYRSWCKARRIVVEFVRLHPLAEWQCYAGKTVADRETIWIDVVSAGFREGYEARCASSIKKAERHGVLVRDLSYEMMAGRFSTFYREGMRRIGADPFYMFSDAYFSAFAQLEGTRLLACEVEGEWIAAGMFLAGGDCLEYHLSATTENGRRLCATNLLIDAAAGWAHQHGLSRVYLGGGTDAREDNPLLKFKKSFSGLRRLYRYGYMVHDEPLYESLRNAHPNPGRRVMFYRQ